MFSCLFTHCFPCPECVIFPLSNHHHPFSLVKIPLAFQFLTYIPAPASVLFLWYHISCCHSLSVCVCCGLHPSPKSCIQSIIKPFGSTTKRVPESVLPFLPIMSYPLPLNNLLMISHHRSLIFTMYFSPSSPICVKSCHSSVQTIH